MACRHDNESENITKFEPADDCIMSMARSIAYASAEKIEALSGSRQERFVAIETAAAATTEPSLDPSVYIYGMVTQYGLQLMILRNIEIWFGVCLLPNVMYVVDKD